MQGQNQVSNVNKDSGVTYATRDCEIIHSPYNFSALVSFPSRFFFLKEKKKNHTILVKRHIYNTNKETTHITLKRKCGHSLRTTEASLAASSRSIAVSFTLLISEPGHFLLNFFVCLSLKFRLMCW